MSLKVEIVGDVCRLPSGALVIRPRAGVKLALTGYAEMPRLADGGFAVRPLPDLLTMEQARKMLGVPYTTLRRIIEMEAVKAHKRSAGRWVVNLESVIALKKALETDPEYWENLMTEARS